MMNNAPSSSTQNDASTVDQIMEKIQDKPLPSHLQGVNLRLEIARILNLIRINPALPADEIILVLSTEREQENVHSDLED